jgi:Histidine kinase-, DNA gyrase B-, and HSP90-like ATPase
VNAIEAMEGRQMPPLVRLLAAATNSNEMLIQVIDNGPGVDDPERIFDAFMTTKEKGMGIGLAVSRSIIEVHGGRLWVGNNREGGATFNVALPLSPQTAHDAFQKVDYFAERKLNFRAAGLLPKADECTLTMAKEIWTRWSGVGGFSDTV